MTAPHDPSSQGALPRTDRVRHPARVLLRSPLRPLARAVMRRRFAVRVHGAEHVPARGPVVFACNHVGALDGPLLAAFAPREVHTLTKHEMFRGRLGTFLRASGQIPLDRFHSDPAAVKATLRVLRDGGTVGVFPEGRRGDGELGRFHRGTAYFALVTGAPVIPVAMLGTREPGGHMESLPRPGGAVHLVFGAPFRCEPRRWPRTKEQVGYLSMLIREHMLVHLDLARALTGQELPGPLPADDVEPDPATGVTEQGAT